MLLHCLLPLGGCDQSRSGLLPFSVVDGVPLASVAKRSVGDMASAPSDSPRAVESARVTVAPAPSAPLLQLRPSSSPPPPVFPISFVCLREPAAAHWQVVLLSIPLLLPAGLELAWGPLLCSLVSLVSVPARCWSASKEKCLHLYCGIATGPQRYVPIPRVGVRMRDATVLQYLTMCRPPKTSRK